MPDLDRTSRLRGGLLGLLVGDALGVPYEFHDAADIPLRSAIEMTPPPGFDRSHARIAPGTWSDDGAQALVVLESLLRLGQLDVDDLGQGFLRWHHEGFLAVDGLRFDIGNQTSSALARIEDGIPAAEAGGSTAQMNGNGSLMRVLPVALWHEGSDHGLVVDAMSSSLPTHAHLRSLVCCALYCVWARRLLAGMPIDAAWDDAVATLVTILTPEGVGELRTHVLDALDAPVCGSGYVVHSLLATRHLLRTERSYEDVVHGAIALGQDTDTTAAIAGGLAGIVYGEQGIPERWLAALRGRELLDPLLEELCEAL